MKNFLVLNTSSPVLSIRNCPVYCLPLNPLLLLSVRKVTSFHKSFFFFNKKDLGQRFYSTMFQVFKGVKFNFVKFLSSHFASY